MTAPPASGPKGCGRYKSRDDLSFVCANCGIDVLKHAITKPGPVERAKFLCVHCHAEWVSPAHSRCEACGRIRSQYSIGEQAGHAAGRKEAEARLFPKIGLSESGWTIDPTHLKELADRANGMSMENVEDVLLALESFAARGGR